MKRQNQIINKQNDLVFHSHFSYLKVHNLLWAEVPRKSNCALINQAKFSFTNWQQIVAKSNKAILNQFFKVKTYQQLEQCFEKQQKQFCQTAIIKPF